jgi:hypothetical protein
LIADDHAVGEGRSESIVIEHEPDQTAPLEGEALIPLSGWLFFITTENADGAWSIRWECRD